MTCVKKDNPIPGSKVVIKQAKIQRDGEGRTLKGQARSKRFGFVEFESHEHALHALRALNNNPAVFGNNNRLIIEFALDDQRKLLKRKKQAQRLEEKKAKKAAKAEAEAEIQQKKEQPKEKDKKEMSSIDILPGGEIRLRPKEKNKQIKQDNKEADELPKEKKKTEKVEKKSKSNTNLSDKPFRGQCFVCNEHGHTKSKCPNKEEIKQKKKAKQSLTASNNTETQETEEVEEHEGKEKKTVQLLPYRPKTIPENSKEKEKYVDPKTAEKRYLKKLRKEQKKTKKKLLQKQKVVKEDKESELVDPKKSLFQKETRNYCET